MIRFKCPNCNTVLQIGKEYAGQSVLCSSCNTQLIVPQIQVPEPTLDKTQHHIIICICGQCKSTYKVPAASAGRQVPCPKCGHSAQIPEQEQVITDSNTLKFACPSCRQAYCVLAKYAGKKFKCPVCKQPCLIPQPAWHPEDLLLLKEDLPPPPPKEEAPAAGRELSFKLQEEPEERPDDKLELLRDVSPSPPPSPVSPPPRPDEKPQKTREKAPGSPLKLFAGIIGGILGFIAGFVIVYMLVRSGGSGEEAAAPARQETDAPAADQNPQAIDFARSIVTRINRKSKDLSELIYQFPDDVYVNDSLMESLVSALDIGRFSAVDSVVESAKTGVGASYYIVKINVASDSGQNREIRIGFFEIAETDEIQLTTELVRWIYGIAVFDETGQIMASVGQTNPDLLAAQMDDLVDKYGSGVSEEEEAQTGRLLTFLAPYMCTLLIVYLIARLIMIICQVAILINDGEPGWAILVPMYRQVVLARAANKDEWMGWLCGLAEMNLYFSDFFGIFLPAVFMIVSPIVYLFFSLIFALGIAKTHNRGVVFGLGLFFLPIIFYPILAFSGKAYD